MDRAISETGTVTRAAIAAALGEARVQTLDLVAPISEDDLVRQHTPFMSPLVWDLAHIGHFQELWLVRRLAGDPPLRPEFDDYYDAARHARNERSELPLLGPDDARAYIEAVRARALEVLAETELDPADRLLAEGFVYGIVIQHEHQHNETLLQTLNLMASRATWLPAPPVAAPATGPTEVLVEGGRCTLGAVDEPWAYDNERPAHDVDLHAFWIDRLPVSNADFAAFIADRGYERPELWADAGWAHRLEAGLTAPLGWSKADDGGWQRTRFGVLEPLPDDEPVQHVSWYEADAYARWAGKRLPTEAEWERAAAWDPVLGRLRYPWGEEPPTAERANLGAVLRGPRAVGSAPGSAAPSGAEQLIGDVWEWTSSSFEGYDGFEAFPYREYSEVFFGSEYKVLRGGSWATHPSVARASFRNWDLPLRRQLFAGFRCAREA